MLEETSDREEIIERVAALDIGKAELVCCVRVPGAEGKSRRVWACTRCIRSGKLVKPTVRQWQPEAETQVS